MAHATGLLRRDATRLTRRKTTVQLRTDPELRIRPQFKLPDWLLMASWSFGRLLSSFSITADKPVANRGFCFSAGLHKNSFVRACKGIFSELLLLGFGDRDANNEAVEFVEWNRVKPIRPRSAPPRPAPPRHASPRLARWMS